MIGTRKFWHAYCCHVVFVLVFLLFFFCEISKVQVLSRSMSWSTWIKTICKYASPLTGLAGDVKTGWRSSMLWEIFFQIKFVIFAGCPTYLASPLHIISYLFSHFCLFQNAILLKMLNLGFSNFKPTFIRM